MPVQVRDLVTLTGLNAHSLPESLLRASSCLTENTRCKMLSESQSAYNKVLLKPRRSTSRFGKLRPLLIVFFPMDDAPCFFSLARAILDPVERAGIFSLEKRRTTNYRRSLTAISE